MDYYHAKNIKGSTMTATRLKVEEALKSEGFGVLTEIDIEATMKKKLDKDYLPHLILGACNPVFADKVLSVDQHISLMLPCNVTIREIGNKEIEVAFINPLEAMKAIDNPIIEAYAKEVSEKAKYSFKKRLIAKEMNIKDLLHPDKAVSTAMLLKTEQASATAIQILQGEQLKEHITIVPALLICILGKAVFENEQGVKETLQAGDYTSIDPMIKHWVNAITDSQFILFK